MAEPKGDTVDQCKAEGDEPSSAVPARQGSAMLRSMVVSRLMGPSEANIYGNVHGGVILRMIDEAGTIQASRYCNNAPNRIKEQEAAVAALARIEHMDFLQPMHIGEVAELQAEIVYTAHHSLMVIVKVWAENIITGEKRMTNRARLWYVPVAISNDSEVLSVPPMAYLSRDAEAWGKSQYDLQKANRKVKKEEELSRPIHTLGSVVEHTEHTVSASQTCLSVIVGTNDVSFNGTCLGGVLLKLMDECAGTTCCKHCRGVCVTACIEATNFHRKIPRGSLIFVHSWLTFTSSRSMEVEVVVEFESRWKGSASERTKAVDAFFTFVHLDESGKVQLVPQLKCVTEDEERKWTEGEARYHGRKTKSAAEKVRSATMQQLEEDVLEAERRSLTRVDE